MELLHISELDGVSHTRHGYQHVVYGHCVLALASKLGEDLRQIRVLSGDLSQLFDRVSILVVQRVDFSSHLLTNGIHNMWGSVIFASTFTQSGKELPIIHVNTSTCKLCDDSHSLSWLQVFLGRLEDDVDEVILCHLAVLLEVSVPQVVF